MKILYSTLKQLIPELDLGPEQIAQLLNLKSFEVNAVLNPEAALQSVKVGTIIQIKAHPGADKLQLVQVSVADQKLSIVCGAKNIAVGQKVPVALVGSVLPNGMSIQVAKLRGQESFGMLCSAQELGLDLKQEGILILPPQAQEGESIVKVLGLDETIIEIDNKGLGTRASDSSSFYGLAREVSIITEQKLHSFEYAKLPNKSLARRIHQQTQKCQYYSLIEVSGLSRYKFDSNVLSKGGYRVDLYVQTEKFTLNPQIVHTLQNLGMSLHHPAVDLGNYIMLEIGQPVHVFDQEKVKGDITIREAQAGETMLALDGKELTLSAGDILICDQEKIIALAGIIGSKDSAVDDGTTKVLIESANFEALQIRKTARRLKILTESAKRFERGLPIELAQSALQRIAHFLKEADLSIEGYSQQGKIKSAETVVKIDFDYIRSYIGVAIPDQTIEHFLKLLEVKVQKSLGSKFYHLRPPYWRLDLNTPEDYIEEIARLFGYDKIPARLNFGLIPVKHHPLFELKRSLTEALVARGYTEVITYPYSQQGQMSMLNPVDASRPYLRVNLVDSLQQAIVNNQVYRDKLKLFELGHIFDQQQPLHLALGYWDKTSSASDWINQAYQDMLSVLVKIAIDIIPIRMEETADKTQVFYQDSLVGWIDSQLGMLELDLSQLLTVSAQLPEVYQPINRYPAVKRDITIVQPKASKPQLIYTQIQNLVSERCEYIALKETFFSEKGKHYTFRLEFRALDRSLTDSEVNQEIDRIEQYFASSLIDLS